MEKLLLLTIFYEAGNPLKEKNLCLLGLYKAFHIAKSYWLA